MGLHTYIITDISLNGNIGLPFFHSFSRIGINFRPHGLKSRTGLHFKPHDPNLKVPSLWNIAILTKYPFYSSKGRD